MDTASNPVVTMCGHLYCWPCLHKWLTSGNTASHTCPVCKSLISKEKCIPIYAHGRESRDPRNDVPQRPAGHREEAPPPQPRRPPGSGVLGSNTHVSLGFGPLGMFGLQLVGELVAHHLVNYIISLTCRFSAGLWKSFS